MLSPTSTALGLRQGPLQPLYPFSDSGPQCSRTVAVVLMVSRPGPETSRPVSAQVWSLGGLGTLTGPLAFLCLALALGSPRELCYAVARPGIAPTHVPLTHTDSTCGLQGWSRGWGRAGVWGHASGELGENDVLLDVQDTHTK